MKTYDCFLFFNELDLLELRLKTLNDVVDVFVLVESPWTFSGKPKPLYYSDNKDRFAEWSDKIRVVIPKGEPKIPDPWMREYLSRECMAAGIRDAAPDDLVFQSDADEIWRPEKKLSGPDYTKCVVYEMYHSYYYFNTPRVPNVPLKGTRRTKAKNWPGGQKLRQEWGPRVEDGGWHFSFLGDAQNAKKKLQAYAHTEHSNIPLDVIQGCIDAGTDIVNGTSTIARNGVLEPVSRYLPIPIDDTFPKPILEDPERWRRYIRET